MTLQRHIETALSAVICALLLIWLSSCAVVRSQILDEEMGWMLDAVTRPVASGAVATGWTDTNSYTGLWEFETTNTTQYLDTSGNGIGLTWFDFSYPPIIAGTNQYGRVEYFMSALASGQYAQSATNITTSTTSMTVTCWAYLDASGTKDRAVFTAWKTATEPDTCAFSLGFYSGEADKVGCSIMQTAHSIVRASSTNTFPYGLWVHLAVIADGTKAYLYTNMVACNPAGTSYTGINLPSGTNKFTVGALRDNIAVNSALGRIDNVTYCAYPRTLTSISNEFINTHPTNNVRIRP